MDEKLKEALDTASENAGWALCAYSGGAGRGKCDPANCVCHGEAKVAVDGFLASLTASGFKVVPVEPTEVRGFTMPEIVEIGKAILPHLSAETTTQIGSIAFDVSVAVTKILRAREAAYGEK